MFDNERCFLYWAALVPALLAANFGTDDGLYELDLDSIALGTGGDSQGSSGSKNLYTSSSWNSSF